jgi:succinate--hydroxymethylglutarate CoA-transferase
VKNRDVLEELIEAETKKKTTQEWLEVFEGCGMRKSCRGRCGKGN